MKSQVAVLTGGGDRPYALGLATSLADHGVPIDFIGSDFLESPELSSHRLVRVLNLRGDITPDAPTVHKVLRVVLYYLRLLRYAAFTDVRLFHVLWNNKFETFDRTLLMLYYRLFGRRVVMTVHNVNIRKRDGNDTFLNRLTLKAQYHSCAHLFVHTEQMKLELEQEFAVPPAKISVIPFGINATVPDTDLTPADARRQLGLGAADQVVLFFGNIAPYKGLEFLVGAAQRLKDRLPRLRLVIAGRPKGAESYWANVSSVLAASGVGQRAIQRVEYVPDAETEIYFKAADVVALPYTHVFQSGVLFLAYNFGLPVIASDVASMRADIIEEKTGFVCRPADPDDLAQKIEAFFASTLYATLSSQRAVIREFAHERYSWSKVATITKSVYAAVGGPGHEASATSS